MLAWVGDQGSFHIGKSKDQLGHDHEILKKLLAKLGS
jgi:hypothetical protein